MSFREIDDAFWGSIKSYLSPQKPYTGRPHADMRKLMNGILYVVMDRLNMERRYSSLWL